MQGVPQTFQWIPAGSRKIIYLNPKYGLKIGDIYLAYLLFADDIVLFSEFAESLQAQIDLFYKYCEIWNLIISIAKTKNSDLQPNIC